MLGKWTELLPVFIVRWLALRKCERMFIKSAPPAVVVVMARPDILVRVPVCERSPRGCWNEQCQKENQCRG